MNSEALLIECKASPLKPSVIILLRVRIFNFDVVCLPTDVSIYFCSMPIPLSDTTIFDIPPSSILIVILFAFASIEFSINSFTTATGLSITSPAAISFIISGGNNFISCILL